MKHTVIAKITRPDSGRVCPRERLFRLLDESWDRLVWVAGPAGSGKTSLAASYLEQRKLPSIWYNVDESDSDIATFFYYMGLAAKRAFPSIRKTLPLLAPEYLPGIPTFTLRYFETLYSRMKVPYVLVIDNCQHVPPEGLFHEVIAAGVSMIPDGIKVLLISRSEPPAAFSRLRANGGMALVGWNDLRFTAEESRAMIVTRTPGICSKEMIQRVQKIAEGWAAGLVLISESVKRGADPQYHERSAPEEIIDYFGSELFGKTGEETRDFLMKTAQLPWMTPAMVEELTGITRGGAVLSILRKSNYFLERQLADEPVYRYHPLFRGFLLGRAKEALSPEEIRNLGVRAALLFEQSGWIEEAVKILIGQDNRDALARLILQHAPALIAQGRSRTLEEWMGTFSQEEMESLPWLLYWKGVCRLPYNLSEGRSHFERAFDRFGTEGNAAGQFLSWSGIVESITWEWNDFKPLDHWIPLLEDLLKRYIVFPSPDIEVRVTMNMLNALLHRKPHYSVMAVWQKKLQERLQRVSDNRQRLLMGSALLLYNLWMGEYAKAALLVEQIQPDSHFRAVEPIAYFIYRFQESVYHWITGDPKGSLELSARSLKEAHSCGIHQFDFMFLAHNTYAMLSQGDFSAARELLRQMKEVMHPARRLDVGHYHYIAAWECMLRGDLVNAHELIMTARTLVEDAGSLFPQSTTLIALSYVHIARAEYADALSCIEKAGEIARNMKSALLEFMVLIAAAHLALEQGDDEQCLTSLCNAFAIGKKRGIVNHGWWLPGVMTRLCAKSLEAGIEVEYVQNLIRKRNLVPDDLAPDMTNWPWPLKVQTLGRFEIARDGEPLVSLGKVQQKPLVMLKVLIALDGRSVSGAQISDVMWPDANGDQAHRAFETTLYRLRQLLGDERILQLKGGLLTMDRRHSWVDSWTFEHVCNQAENHWRNSNVAGPQEAMRLGEKAIALYHGHFLPADDREAWAAPTRERLRSRFLRTVMRLGRHWEDAGDYGHALEYFERGLEIDELAEELHQHVMACLHRMGRRSDAVRAYERCRSALSSTFGITPSEKTEEILRAIRAIRA